MDCQPDGEVAVVGGAVADRVEAVNLRAWLHKEALEAMRETHNDRAQAIFRLSGSYDGPLPKREVVDAYMRWRAIRQRPKPWHYVKRWWLQRALPYPKWRLPWR